MGLFDFFKDGDDLYEENHKEASNKSSFDAGQFSNNTELIAWLENNKVILLSEDDGLVVYTNDADENFLQIFSSLSQAKAEDISEYVEVNSNDLRDLLAEMPDIMYVVLNPNTDDLMMTRGELLKSEDNIQPEIEKDFSEPFEVNKINEVQEPVSIDQSEAGSHSFKDFEATKDFPSDHSVAVSPDFEVISGKAEFMNTVAPIDDEGFDLLSSEFEEKEKTETPAVKENPKENIKNLNYQEVSEIPSPVIERVLQFRDDGIKKFYLAESSREGRESKDLSLLLDAESVHAQSTLPMTKILVKDNSEEARVLEDKKYLIYDEDAIKEMADSYSENDLLSYFQENFLIYSLPVYNEEVEGTEVNVFTDFTQIPSLFLKSFDSFKVANFEKFVEFLEKDDSIDFVHVNPFTKPLYISREVFIAKKYQVPAPVHQGNVLNVLYTDDKSTALVYLITTLKDFSLSNLEIGEEENRNFVLTFKNEQDAEIAKQVIKMKTDYKVK